MSCPAAEEHVAISRCGCHREQPKSGSGSARSRWEEEDQDQVTGIQPGGLHTALLAAFACWDGAGHTQDGQERSALTSVM
ncbi:hypothetical protein AB5N19_03912 [Seiridium cardinale]